MLSFFFLVLHTQALCTLWIYHTHTYCHLTFCLSYHVSIIFQNFHSFLHSPFALNYVKPTLNTFNTLHITIQLILSYAFWGSTKAAWTSHTQSFIYTLFDIKVVQYSLLFPHSFHPILSALPYQLYLPIYNLSFPSYAIHQIQKHHSPTWLSVRCTNCSINNMLGFHTWILGSISNWTSFSQSSNLFELSDHLLNTSMHWVWCSHIPV